MRFSLLTLVLGVLTAGSVMGCWMQSGAWIKQSTIQGMTWAEVKKKYFPTGVLGDDSPDGTRTVSDAEAPFIYNSQGDSFPIFAFPERGEAYFLDDDTVMVIPWLSWTEERFDEYSLWHRRYPEWWWGHFYRPEVWSALVFGVLLVLNIFRERRVKRAEKAGRA